MKTFFNHFVSGYRGHSARTWVAVFSSFVDSIGTSVAIFLALYLSNVINFPIEQVGFIISAFGIGIFFGSYLGGFLCDKFDSHKVSISMLVASGLATALIPYFSNFIAITGVVTLGGLFYGAFKPANTLNLFRDCSAKDRARINGLYRVATNLGMGVASLIGGILVSISFPLVFWFDGLTSGIAAAILFYFYRSSSKIKKSESVALLQPRKRVFDGVFFTLCLLLLINCFVFFQIRAAYPLYLNKYYYLSARIFGYLFLLNCIMIVLIEVPLLNAARNCNQIIIAAIGSALICFSMFLLPFGDSLLWAISLCVLLTLGEILLFSTILTLIIDRASESDKGKYIGVYQSMFGLASMLAPALGNYIYSFQPSFLWYLCGLIGLGSVFTFQIMNLSVRKSNLTITSIN